MGAQNKGLSVSGVLYFLLFCIGFLAVIVFDVQDANRSFFSESTPRHTFDYLFRTGIIFIGTVFLFSGLNRLSSQPPLLKTVEFPDVQPLLIVLTLAIAVVALLVFLIEPDRFHELSVEDGLVEWASALLLFSSSVLAFRYGLKGVKSMEADTKVKLTFYLLSLCLFLVAMEEISWFQRVFDINTPESFSENLQKELNFHNFYTDIVENIYYTGAFVFLVLCPSFRLFFPDLTKCRYLEYFIPQVYIGVIGSIACAYSYDMWNIALTQFTFFSSIIILAFYIYYAASKRERLTLFLALIVCIESQVLFLAYGHGFVRLWDVTEFREFFIPVGFFLYFLGLPAYMKQKQVVDS